MNKRFFNRLTAVCVASLLTAASMTAQTTDRGFRHPGGMHTEADFERVRQQLAEGNETVTAAWNVLKNAAYSQSGVQTYPVETIVRGGGSGENYINAARGATMAYQNALRWRIEGKEEHAKAAVRILMAWANTTKLVTGDSNYALASGLYGYEFAQAAELVRDYEGWSREDFETFKRWMLDVWYPPTIGFMRGRNGSWENVGKWWQAPGHYWSNWGLCNALCLISIGVLCDDVFIYNQGVSFMKYDQVGNWKEGVYADPIMGDGLNEFIGYLVPYVEDDERGPYGQLGQMQESGRDQGHATMSLGLAIDIAQTLWNQGNDFYSYKNNRLAAGIEWTAAYNNAKLDDLPWHNFHYYTSGFAWTDSRSNLMTQPSDASRGQTRAYWAKVIGHYEGVLGVKMQYSRIALQQMGIDGGGGGGASGAYDHLGYSVLMNTRDGMAPADKVPTLLTPRMTVDGKVYEQAELGGLVNTYKTNNNTCVVRGTVITLSPQLPEGEEDTGNWQWNTGETTREITLTADKSFIYRATYTNKNGVKSEQGFSIAVAGDCYEALVTPYATLDDNDIYSDSMRVFYNEQVTLGITPKDGYGTTRWDNGTTAASRTLTVKKDTTVSVAYKNQGGREQTTYFRLFVDSLRHRIIVNSEDVYATKVIVSEGDAVSISPKIGGCTGKQYLWSDGSTSTNKRVTAIDSSIIVTLDFTSKQFSFTQEYQVLVNAEDDYALSSGNYYLLDTNSGRYLTNAGDGAVAFADSTGGDAQKWYVEHSAVSAGNRYTFTSLSDSAHINMLGKLASTASKFCMRAAKGTDRLALFTSSERFWTVTDTYGLNILGQTELVDFPFRLIPADDATSIRNVDSSATVVRIEYFGIDGTRIAAPDRGIVIRRCYLSDGTVKVEKVFK